MCSSSDCAGCAYSKVSALFHSGPRRECYQRFFISNLPWNVLRRGIAKTGMALRRRVASRRRKEELQKEQTYALTGLAQ